jgi:hypothetical protein
MVGVEPAAAEDSDEDRRQGRQRQGEQHARQPGGFRHAEVVDHGEREHGGGREGFGMGGGDVAGEGQRHGCAGGGLADDEAPSRGESPPRAEALAAVDVGAAGLRILRGQHCRAGRVAVGHHPGDQQADQ